MELKNYNIIAANGTRSFVAAIEVKTLGTGTVIMYGPDKEIWHVYHQPLSIIKTNVH